MLPIAALPDSPLTTGHAPDAPPLVDRQATGKAGLDLRPAIGVVRITRRQSPQAMQVIRQDHDRQHLERPCRTRSSERRPQIVDPIDQQPAAPFQQVDGEEVGAAWHPHAAIVRHPRNVANPLAPRYQRTPPPAVGERHRPPHGGPGPTLRIIAAGSRRAGSSPPYAGFLTLPSTPPPLVPETSLSEPASFRSPGEYTPSLGSREAADADRNDELLRAITHLGKVRQHPSKTLERSRHAL